MVVESWWNGGGGIRIIKLIFHYVDENKVIVKMPKFTINKLLRTNFTVQIGSHNII